MSTPFRWGPEFLADIQAGTAQQEPAVAGLPDGRFVTAWTNGEAFGAFNIEARLYNADRSAGGPPISIAIDADGAFQPAITGLADGKFIVAWTQGDFGGDIGGYAQVFNADGTTFGSQFAVGSPVDGMPIAPIITQLADGRLLATWMEDSETGSGPDGSEEGVFAQFIAIDGSPAGDVFLVNTTTLNEQNHQAVAALANGGFVVAWEDLSHLSADTDGTAIRAQVFDVGGSKVGDEFLVNTATFSHQQAPAIAALANGRFVIVWHDFSGVDDETNWAIRGQVFEADGKPFGTEFRLNTTTTGDQREPTIVALDDGGFLVAWEDAQNGLSDGDTITAQRFDADGDKVGIEFGVNTIEPGDQNVPAAAVLADGRVVVFWEDDSQSADAPFDPVVRGQIVDPRDAAADFFGTQFDDQFVGTAFDDRLAGRIGDDRLWGENGSDLIRGNAGNDELHGGGGGDFLIGGRHRDKLFGDAGGDVFVFGKLKHMAKKGSARDVVMDFDAQEGDLIDLHRIDARKGGADNDFAFVGTDAFTGKKGELRIVEKASKVIVKGDVDGDGRADFAIKVKGVGTLAEDDFVL